MYDVVVAICTANGISGLILLVLSQQSGLQGGAALVAALHAFGPGGLLGGVLSLLLIQALTIPLVMIGFVMYYCWASRDAYDSLHTMHQAMVKIASLRISTITRALIVARIARNMGRHLIAAHKDKQNSNDNLG